MFFNRLVDGLKEFFDPYHWMIWIRNGLFGFLGFKLAGPILKFLDKLTSMF